MQFLPDARLYHDTAYCLDFAKTIVPVAHKQMPPPTLFHFYWWGGLSRKVVCALKSFLLTQDPVRAEAWLWIDTGAPNAEATRAAYEHEFGAQLRVLLYTPLKEAEGTPFANDGVLVDAGCPAGRSDAFRLLALYRHGGVYADADTLFLRDFAPLLDSPFGRGDFCYRWSAETPASTNAIMHLRAGGTTAAALMRRAHDIGSCHPRALLKHDREDAEDILELPCVFFDPLWPHFDRADRYGQAPFDTFKDFFRPFGWFHRKKPGFTGLNDFFPGAFAYQWHGSWSAPEVRASYFGLLEAEIARRLEQKTAVSAA